MFVGVLIRKGVTLKLKNFQKKFQTINLSCENPMAIYWSGGGG